MIADPAAIEHADLSRSIPDIDAVRYYVLADLVSSNVAAPSPIAPRRPSRWMASDRWRNARWDMLAILALKDQWDCPTHTSRLFNTDRSRPAWVQNRVRYLMNGALIAIGLRNERLRERANAITTIIGKVNVDHGDTGCRTRTRQVTEKAWARKGARSTAA